MVEEIGMAKSGLSQAERTSPTAKTSKTIEQARVREAAEAEKAKEATDEIAEEVATGLNDLVHELHRELHFAVDKDSGDTIIKVVDRATDEVVRQIPSEEMVKLHKRLQETSGVIFQDSA